MLHVARGCVARLGARVLRAPGRPLSGQSAASYAKLVDSDVTYFRSILGDNDVITDASALEPYNTDWMKKYHGNSKLALRPRSTQQVSQILKHCNERKLAVVPQGGNTGLVGGSVAVADEVVLSLSGMDKILAFDEFAGTVTVQAGAVLQAVQEKAEAHGYAFPLDLGAKGSCQIGGNVATNAGGLRFLRFGSLHGTVLGIEAVLADGTIIDNLSTLKKDNTGYDIKQLFIGSEGTLGVLTGVAIALPKLPNSIQLAYLALDSYASVLKVFKEAKGHLAEILSAVEFLDDQALELTLAHLHGARNPLETRAPFYMLIEVSGSNEEHDSAKLTGFLEHVMEAGMVSDGTLAADSTQMAAVWHIREGISEALSKAGAVYKYDISLPLPELYDLVTDTRARLADEDANVVAFGHIGDGNVHLNISTPTKSESVFNKLEPWVFEWTQKRRGSISAEHGVGVMKPKYVHLSKSKESIELMKKLKAVMDPNGILNPYKVLPATE
ncbi:D-2-hydroxyglutarate dehydrogenase [Pavlovales sp. CCMP2436]|nr:D-2-hydroxyglutarate dehydrogenase [Pavlovales sp. CCMP2436]